MSRASVKHVIPYKTTVFAYYKGTRVPPLPPKAFAQIEPGAYDLIKTYLTTGMTLAQVGQIVAADLDEWEQKLVDYQAAHPVDGRLTTAEKWLGGAWGPEYGKIWCEWYLSVAILLKLKIINNDAMNGWLVAEM